jgi:hypothetical protein
MLALVVFLPQQPHIVLLREMVGRTHADDMYMRGQRVVAVNLAIVADAVLLIVGDMLALLNAKSPRRGSRH